MYRLMNFLAPGICYLCEDFCSDQSIFCANCSTDLPRACEFSGSCEEQNSTGIQSANGRIAQAAIDQTITTHTFKFPVNELIHQLKYNQKLLIAKQLGLDLASVISKVGAPLPDCLIPVPLYRLRFLTRGFNQALEIANVVGRELSLPVDAGLVARRRNTLAQYALNPAQRAANLRRAFRLNSMPEYDFVAIIDDVITTGSTVKEMARVLKKAGVKRVAAWACARAEP